MSAPLHSVIGFGTKLPTRSGNSAYPQNTCTSAGWFTKCGCWASTMDVSQFESLNVTSPPVPASLPLNCCILSKNAGFFSVTVNDSQQDCAMQLLKATGLPNCDRPFASFSQRVQPPLSTLVSFLGALVIEPRLEASVMEPFCMKTRSPSFTAITSLLSCRRQ